MKRIVPASLLLIALSPAQAGAPAAGDLPRIDGVPAVASVNGEPISLDAYRRSLGELHAQVQEGGPMVGRKDPAQLLDRLIELRLLLQEAREIGLSEQPEFQAAIRAWHKQAMREALIRHAVKDVTEPTAAEIARRYGDEVRQYRIRPVRFSSVEAAEAFLASVKAGAVYDDERQRLAGEGKAVAEEDGWIERRGIQPSLVAALDPLEPGGITGAVAIQDGAVVMKLLERREPEDAAMREEARKMADAANKNAALAAFVAKLKEDNLKIDEELFATLDFEKDPDAVEVHLKDERVLATVKDGPPILVKDYTAVLKRRFFHGVERAGDRKLLNKAKDNVLEEVVTERVLDDAAVRLKLDATPAFRADQADFEEATLFGYLVDKVVDPSVQVPGEAVTAYYEAHKTEYATPAMARLDAISFTDGEAAQAALTRLNAGADLAWTREHAESQIDRAGLPDEQRFEGRLLTEDGLPQGLRKAIEGAAAGSYRLWSEGPDRHHVVLVRDRVPGATPSLDAVRDDVARRVFQERRNAEVDALAATLRAAAEIEVFADGEKLRALLMKSASAGTAAR